MIDKSGSNDFAQMHRIMDTSSVYLKNLTIILNFLIFQLMFVSNGGTQTSDITNNEEEDGKQIITSLFQFRFLLLIKTALLLEILSIIYKFQASNNYF